MELFGFDNLKLDTITWLNYIQMNFDKSLADFKEWFENDCKIGE